MFDPAKIAFLLISALVLVGCGKDHSSSSGGNLYAATASKMPRFAAATFYEFSKFDQSTKELVPMAQLILCLDRPTGDSLKKKSLVISPQELGLPEFQIKNLQFSRDDSLDYTEFIWALEELELYYEYGAEIVDTGFEFRGVTEFKSIPVREGWKIVSVEGPHPPSMAEVPREFLATPFQIYAGNMNDEEAFPLKDEAGGEYFLRSRVIRFKVSGNPATNETLPECNLQDQGVVILQKDQIQRSLSEG